MPSLLQSVSKFAPGGARTPAIPARTTQPTPISGKFYNHMRDFTAWNPWGQPTGHSVFNHKYIPISGRSVKQCDYPAEMQKLIDSGWQAANRRSEAKKDNGIFLGNARLSMKGTTASNGPANPLRKGFGAIRNNWDHITKFEQVAAFAFRGDTRAPELILADGGFRPPSMRTDLFYRQIMAEEFCSYLQRKTGDILSPQESAALIAEVQRYMANQGPESKMFAEYHFWRTVLDQQKMHLMGMTVNSFLKAYISTSRDITVASSAAAGFGAGVRVQKNGQGWVYCLRVKSGFLLKAGIGGVKAAEGEIAHLGPLSWKNVYGFMQCPLYGTPSDIYIRSTLFQEDIAAFHLVLRSFSSLIVG